jgi:hypothetical protein
MEKHSLRARCCCDRSIASPTFRIQRASWERVVKEEIITAKLPPRMPVHCLGLAQQCLACMYGPGPGAPVGVLRIGSFSTLNLCTGSRSLAGGQANRRWLEVIQDTEDSILSNDQKPEGRALGSWQGACREACEDQTRPAPGKIPPAYHHSSTADSLSFGLSSCLRVKALWAGGVKRC